MSEAITREEMSVELEDIKKRRLDAFMQGEGKGLSTQEHLDHEVPTGNG